MPVSRRPTLDNVVMHASAASRRIGFLCLGVTSLGWGLNWPAMKVLLHQLALRW